MGGTSSTRFCRFLMFVKYCKLVNGLTTEWQLEISVECQEPCFSQDPKSCNGCTYGWPKSLVTLRQGYWSNVKRLIAADILLRRLLHKLTFDIGEPKDPYCFLIEPQELQFSIGFGWDTYIYIHKFNYIYYSHLHLYHTHTRRQQYQERRHQIETSTCSYRQRFDTDSTNLSSPFGKFRGFHCVYLEESMGDPEEAETCHLDTWKYSHPVEDCKACCGWVFHKFLWFSTMFHNVTSL